MRIIDGHAFLGKSIYVEQNTQSLITEMNRLGIEVSVVVAPPPGPFYKDANDSILRNAKTHPKRLAALYRANPLLEGEEVRVREALNSGFVGIQLNPTNEGFWVGSPVIEPIIQVAEDLKKVVFIHSGDSIFCPPENVADLALKFDRVNFITSMSRRAPRVAKECANLFLMTRPFPTLAFTRGYAENFDLDRLIFATDSPLGTPEIELKRVELAGLEYDVKEKILGGNLQRIIHK
jgi:predicted TIM-barrel fold metal-dependent hydrolase